ncbi:MAG: DUF4974 domain-containing protein [Chitinophagaceae bacterium]|nr:DUF4974 domain-containing protein [Chitinophagaceae bacterium]
MDPEQNDIDWEKLEGILAKPEQERISLKEQLLPQEKIALEQLEQLQADELLTGALQLDTQHAWNKTQALIGGVSVKPVRTIHHAWKKWVAAACFLVLGGTAWLLWRNRSAEIVQGQSIQQGMAGHTPSAKVQLITATGQTLEVDSLRQFSEKDGTTIYLQQGAMTYRPENGPSVTNNAGDALMNTLIVPRGYLQSLVLSDGTKVWLNADSRISFPVRFRMEEERRVSVQGEVYFEVKHDEQWPFIVSVYTPGHDTQNSIADAEVQVMGTSFNVKAYNNTIYTTLATGSVLFRPPAGKPLQLSPDNQVTYKTQTGVSTLQKISSEDFTSWRSDDLVMDKMSLAELAGLLERRYDVQISFSNESLKKIEYSAALHLTSQVADMLENLEQTGLVRFAVRDKKIIVLPFEK